MVLVGIGSGLHISLVSVPAVQPAIADDNFSDVQFLSKKMYD